MEEAKTTDEVKRSAFVEEISTFNLIQTEIVNTLYSTSTSDEKTKEVSKLLTASYFPEDPPEAGQLVSGSSTPAPVSSGGEQGFNPAPGCSWRIPTTTKAKNVMRNIDK